MRVRAWVVAVFLVAAFSLAAAATEVTHCAGQHATHATRTPDRAQPAGGTPHRGYVVAARMGWAAG